MWFQVKKVIITIIIIIIIVIIIIKSLFLILKNTLQKPLNRFDTFILCMDIYNNLRVLMSTLQRTA